LTQALGPGPTRKPAPGDTGLDFASVLGALMPAAARDRYDIIAFDPRGVDYSAPLTCQLTELADVPPEVADRYPEPNGSIERNVALAREIARLCGEHGGDTMPHVTTANTARDMDLIRAALGERRMSHLGYSYGTYLGAVYRTLFPHRLDRVVLDSAIDPTRFGYGQFRLVGIGARLRLPDFTRWAAGHDETYHLGATSAAVRRTFDRLTAHLDAEPLPLPDGWQFTGNRLRLLTYSGIYHDAGFPGLAEIWQAVAAAVMPATGRRAASAVASRSRQPAGRPAGRRRRSCRRSHRTTSRPCSWPSTATTGSGPATSPPTGATWPWTSSGSRRRPAPARTSRRARSGRSRGWSGRYGSPAAGRATR
jgi:pimeloyl-ACP methyl ester carboxylesterase